ncbi:MAG TPA: hypothetical protein VMU08_06700 [Rhizomicrobium sp.]|nr:hypothetical protein [Rhizomicrobium sp.]
MKRSPRMKRPPKYEAMKRIALALPETREEGHRHGPWFNIGKRPFALYWGKSQSWMIRLPPEHVMMLAAVGKVFRPMRNGSPFWIYIDVGKMDLAMMRDYVTAAWKCTAPRKMRDGLRERNEDDEEDRELQGEAFA